MFNFLFLQRPNIKKITVINKSEGKIKFSNPLPTEKKPSHELYCDAKIKLINNSDLLPNRRIFNHTIEKEKITNQ